MSIIYQNQRNYQHNLRNIRALLVTYYATFASTIYQKLPVQAIIGRTPSPFGLLCHNIYEVVCVATNKSQATGKPGRGLHKKKTNKQDIKQNLYSQGKSADIICALIFGLYNVRHIFLPSTSNEHESFPSALVSLESSCCEFII